MICLNVLDVVMADIDSLFRLELLYLCYVVFGCFVIEFL
jgi:hypothetical protein